MSELQEAVTKARDAWQRSVEKLDTASLRVDPEDSEAFFQEVERCRDDESEKRHAMWAAEDRLERANKAREP